MLFPLIVKGSSVLCWGSHQILLLGGAVSQRSRRVGVPPEAPFWRCRRVLWAGLSDGIGVTPALTPQASHTVGRDSP